jgi:hypothetical protein
MEPGSSMDGYSIARFDPDTGVLKGQPLLLSGAVPDDGKVYIADSAESWVTVKDTENVSFFTGLEDFLLALIKDDHWVDSIQVGGDFDKNGKIEGNPAKNGIFDCFYRLTGGIDTNRNDFDIIGSWHCGS